MNKFLLGVATGVGLSIFLRSKKGQEIISNLKSTASNVISEAIDKGNQSVKDFANDFVSDKKSSNG